MKISLCLIVRNELQGCKIDVPKISTHKFYEVIAIDGNSTDGTYKFLTSQGIRTYKQMNPGLNGAYIDANNFSKGDYVVVFFPKNTLPVNDIYKFEDFFKKGYQLVIASRQIKGSVNEEDSQLIKLRKWGVRFLALFAYYVWSKKKNIIYDVLHGVKGWEKDSFNKMEILNRGVSIDIEMVIRAYKLNLNVIEFPTKEKPRSYGQTNFKIIPTAYKIFKFLVLELFNKNKNDL